MESHWRRALRTALAFLALVSPSFAQAPEGESDGWSSRRTFGGSARIFWFQAVEESPALDDAEQGALRLTLEQSFSSREQGGGRRGLQGVGVEVHGVLSATSPRAGGVGNSGVAGGRSGHRRLDLETEVLSSSLRDDDVRMWAEIDRANLSFEHRRFQLTVGRQAITWGVSYFWPVLDLFGPFAPSAVDRDDKTGVDAVRWRMPVGAFSEVEVVGAAQSRDARTLEKGRNDDWSWGALGRFHVTGTDVGVLAGEFYGDTVAGVFVAGDAGGFGLRGEVLSTRVDDDKLGLPGEAASSFWRATLGFDRLLSARASLSAEISWNGWGADDPNRYAELAASDRVRRGDITSLGRSYAGVSASYQASPLMTVAGALLINASDESALLQPSLVWSISNNASLLAGAFLGAGPGLDAGAEPGSEYGAVPTTVWCALRTFF